MKSSLYLLSFNEYTNRLVTHKCKVFNPQFVKYLTCFNLHFNEMISCDISNIFDICELLKKI